MRKTMLTALLGLAVGLMIGMFTWARTASATAAATPPAGVHECFNNTSKVVTYSSTGTCPSGTTAIPALARQTGVAALDSLLAGVTRTTVNGYPTLRFSGMNLQVVNQRKRGRPERAGQPDRRLRGQPVQLCAHGITQPDHW